MNGKYEIRVKQDVGRYGYYNSKTRRNERTGFVVCQGIVNVIPGACWFKTIEEAMRFVRAAIQVIAQDAVLTIDDAGQPKWLGVGNPAA